MADYFIRYAYIINSTIINMGTINERLLWDGMRIVDKAVFKNGFNDSDQLLIPVKKHRDIIINFF